MFKLNEQCEFDRRIQKCDYKRYSPSKISTINTAKSQLYINILRENSVISLMNTFLDSTIEFIETADNSRYANGNDLRLLKLGPIAFFSKYKLTTCSGKHLEDISHAHIFFKYELKTDARGTDDLSIAFDRDCTMKQQELTSNKNKKDKNFVKKRKSYLRPWL